MQDESAFVDQDVEDILQFVEVTLQSFLTEKGTHSTTILRSFNIDQADGIANCVREVINLIRKAMMYDISRSILQSNNGSYRDATKLHPSSYARTHLTSIDGGS